MLRIQGLRFATRGIAQVPLEHSVLKPPGMNNFVLRWVVQQPWVPIGAANPAELHDLAWWPHQGSLESSIHTLINSLDQVQPSRAASMHRLTRENHMGHNFLTKLHVDYAGPIGKRSGYIYNTSRFILSRYGKRTCKYLQRTWKDTGQNLYHPTLHFDNLILQ